MFHSPLVARHRLFFALRPPIELARRIVAASAWLGGDLLTAERLHLTLLILDDHAVIPSGLVAALHAVGDAVAAAPIAVTLDRLVTTGRSAALRPGHTHPALHALYDQLAVAARAAGIAGRRDHRFSPHVTLGYRPPAAHNEPVRPIGWIADEMLLIHSHLGRTRHETVGAWRLTGTERQPSLF